MNDDGALWFERLILGRVPRPLPRRGEKWGHQPEKRRRMAERKERRIKENEAMRLVRACADKRNSVSWWVGEAEASDALVRGVG